MTKPVDELETISWVLVPWNLGLMSTILTEIIKSWYPLPHMSVNHDVISGSILKWNGKEKTTHRVGFFYLFFGGKSGYPQSCKMHRLLPCKEWAHKIKYLWRGWWGTEGPRLWGKLTQMGTGCLLISSLGQFVYLAYLDLNGWVFTI